MIRAYYTQAPAQIMKTEPWIECYQQLQSQLSESRREQLGRIRHSQSQLNSAIGLMLLHHGMLAAGQANFRLQELVYDAKQKPACPDRPAFNISHSKEVVMCAINHLGTEPVGIDVEHIRDMDATKFYDYIRADELQSATDQEQPFIHCWTQKEAVIKAEGNGGVWDASKVKLQSDSADYAGKKWHLLPLAVPTHYRAHLAYSNPEFEIQCNEIEIKQLLDHF